MSSVPDLAAYRGQLSAEDLVACNDMQIYTFCCRHRTRMSASCVATLPQLNMALHRMLSVRTGRLGLL